MQNSEMRNCVIYVKSLMAKYYFVEIEKLENFNNYEK